MTPHTSETTKAINCTQCGAGQSVLGGGRVKAVGCEYCGAILDAQDDFKVLAQYRDLRRPATPFMLGQTGTLFGVEWTIIGTIGQRETYAGQTWDWVDHQLYSPTHGYCYLTWEDEHYVFTRKVRGPGNNGWYNSPRIERADTQPVTYRNDKRYKYYESGTSQITFAEGSFNWVPAVGDQSHYVSFLGDTEMLTHIMGKTENEVELSTYLDPHETIAAFGLTGKPFPTTIHPVQPYIPWKHSAFARNTAFGMAALGVALWIALMGLGTVVLDERGIDPRAERTLGFTINNANDLVEIRLHNNARNSWAWYDLELVNPSGETVAEFGRLAEYYSGTEGGESWSEGSRTATATLRLEERGAYQLLVEQSEAGIWGSGTNPSLLDVRITEGKKSAFWMLLAAITCALAGGGILFRRIWHNKRRWSGSDWSDED